MSQKVLLLKTPPKRYTLFSSDARPKSNLGSGELPPTMLEIFDQPVIGSNSQRSASATRFAVLNPDTAHDGIKDAKSRSAHEFKALSAVQASASTYHLGSTIKKCKMQFA